MTRLSIQIAEPPPRRAWTPARVIAWFLLCFALCFWLAMLLLPEG
jgi:hypothetical protein